MDWIEYGSRGMDFIKKYRYVLLAVLAGVILLTLPENSAKEKRDSPGTSSLAEDISLEDSLGKLLSKLDGAGKVEVLLTQAKGEEILYQVDTHQTYEEHNQDIKTDTVLISDAGRTEAGLIRQKNPPLYLGAVILCQGADKAPVRLSIVEAVMDITGLTSDKITVLKMK